MEGGSENELYKSMAARMSSESKKKAGEGWSTYQWIRPTICRVPESLRKIKPSAYTPRVVSVGPLHQNDPRLTAFQDGKFRYMHTLLDRTAKSEKTREHDADQTLRECVDAMLKVARRARTCYGQSFNDVDYTDLQLANTLLVDGCFILELLFRFENGLTESNDPVFMNNLALGGIARDLLLLENQIPFFVLQKLFKRTLHKIQNIGDTLFRLHFVWMESKLSLKQYVLRFFRGKMIFGSEMTERDNGTTETSYDHILGFLHNYYEPSSYGYPRYYRVVRYSATQLHRTGVKFKASEGKDNLRVRFRTSTWERRNHQVSTQTSSICCLFSPLRTLLPQTPLSKWWLFPLCRSACLELQPMHVYDYTESFLRNLIAYEQCSLTVPQYISSYALLMDTLVNSKEDVELLENGGVLENNLGSSEDASDLFNNLCKEIFVVEFYFSDQWKQLNKYCNLYWPKHLALLRNTYLSNPWAIISLIGALILFGLTALQTAYSTK